MSLNGRWEKGQNCNMLTLGVIEYFFYGLANKGIDLYLLIVFIIDPAVWEMENMLFPMDAKIDLLFASV